MTAPAQPNRWPSVLPGILLVLLVLAAYFPAARGEFLWDDDSNVVKSAPLRSLTGLFQIWFLPGATQQYYPLTHTSFWLDYHIWGLNPAAYHIENLLLHAASAILLWRLLRRLAVPGAWLGAALFALHPVNVESVAWITERKNCLSGVFFMGSLLAAVRFWRLDDAARAPSRAGKWKFFGLALALYICALWSKTATIGLPALVLLLIWWKARAFSLSDFLLLLPFFAAGIAFAVITMILEKNHLGAAGPEWNFSFAQRCVIAGRATWFYLGKLIWPHPLMFMYPLWKIQAAHIVSWLPLAGLIGALLTLALVRAPWTRCLSAAMGWFVIMLFPVLGFFNVVFYHYSFVCDHFQYLASIGPLALAAAGLAALRGKMGGVQPFICGALVLGMAWLTWKQAHVYRNSETLWADSLARNPNSWMAHDNLGMYYSQERKFLEADTEYLAALKLRPEDYLAWNNLGLDMAQLGQLDDAISDFNQALLFLPNYPLGHYNLGNALARKEQYSEAIRHFRLSLDLEPWFAPAHYSLANALSREGETGAAIKEYETTIRLDPEFAPAHANLGRALAAQGKYDEAILQYQDALALDPDSVDALANLGNALVAQKQFDEAVKTYRLALRQNSNSVIIHYNLAVALDRLGNKEESQKELAEANRLKAAGAKSGLKP